MSNKNQDPYQRFLEERHKTFQTPENVIAGVVEKATGSQLSEMRKIVEGEVNEVYDATVPGKSNVIVRISRFGKNSFETEEKTIRLVTMSGVPAPRVLLIEDAGDVTFCVEEKIEGEPLSKIMKTLEPGVFKSLVVQSGSILSKINSIPVEGFGSLNADVKFQTWEDFIFSFEERRSGIIEGGQKVGVTAEQVDKGFQILHSHQGLFRLPEARLLHGDFSPKHLLVKDGKITGIIDFENAKGGDPVRDIAWVNYFYGDSFPLEYLKEGYADKSIFDENFDLKLNLYKLHLGLDLLNYYNDENNISGLTHSGKRFAQSLQNF